MGFFKEAHFGGYTGEGFLTGSATIMERLSQGAVPSPSLSLFRKQLKVVLFKTTLDLLALLSCDLNFGFYVLNIFCFICFI